MSTQNVIELKKRRRPSHRGLKAAAIALLVIGGATGLYRQAIYLPNQRSEAISLQLQELAESVQQIQSILQTDLPNTDTVDRPPVKVVENQAQTYWLSVEDGEIVLSPQPLSDLTDAEPQAALTAAFDNLLAGPKSNAETSTSIPFGTRLLSLKVTPEAIYVDLSGEFSQGGGSSSMIGRVAQVLYTATSLEPTADVVLSIEGELLNDDNPFGGEGLVLSSPLNRERFIKDFPVNRLKTLND